MAAYHQNLFSLCVDPSIDGHKNTFYEDSVPLPVDELSPFGTGYLFEQTVLTKAGFADLNTQTNRVFKIRNDGKVLLMSDDSYARKPTSFAEQAMWVTKYRDDEPYAAAESTNQSTKDTGLSERATRSDETENTDIVVWHTFGLTHNPRPEDFPVIRLSPRSDAGVP